MRPLSALPAVVVLLAAGNAGDQGAEPAPCAGEDPLVLDMAGDGIDLTGQTTTTLLGGGPRKVRWTRSNSDDAFVALDATSLASAGYVISDAPGTRLSGLVLLRDGVTVQTPSGNKTAIDETWQLARALDANKDGKLDATDPAFSHLRVFSDRNADGAMQATEIASLGERGVRSVSTESAPPRTDGSGNVRRDGTFQATNGAMRQATGVVLAIVEAPPPAPTPIPSPTFKPAPLPTPKPAPLPSPVPSKTPPTR